MMIGPLDSIAEFELAGILVLLLVGAAIWEPVKVAAVGAVAGLMLCAPTVFGVQMNSIGSIVLIASCLPVLLLNKGSDYSWRSVAPVALLSVSAAWLLTRSIIVPTSEIGALALVKFFYVPAIVFSLAAANRQFLDAFIRVFVGLITLSAMLMGLTVAFGLFVGFDRLGLGPLGFGYTDISPNQLLFPGSAQYALGGGGDIPRLLGIGRESGVGAAFIGWAFFAMPDDWRARNALKVTLFIGLLATQSTAGVGLFAICWLVRIASDSARLQWTARVLAVIVAIIITWVAITNTQFGLASKAESGYSLSDRLQGTQAGFDAAFSAPLSADSSEYNASINMLASIADVGLPWFLTMFAVMLLPLLGTRRTDWQRYAGLYVLATVLFAQPLLASTGFVVIAVATLASSRARAPASEPARLADLIPTTNRDEPRIA